jgi:beta-glucanase (GH16 family)
MLASNRYIVLAVVSFLVFVEGQNKLVFEDNFDTFDLTRWKHEITLGGGGNWEFEYYSNNRTNSYVRDGHLYIQPSLLVDDIGEANLMNGFNMDVWGGAPADLCTSNAFYGCFRTSGAGGNYLNPVKSARIRTAESFSFTYGRVEIRAKLPRGDWLWPAIWMLPRDNQYGTWPASGEIDIMESRGNPPTYSAGGYDTFGSTLHFGPAWDANSYLKTHKTLKPGVDLTEDFHVYGLIWNETYMGTYFDDETHPVLSHHITESFWSLGGWKTWNNPWVGEPNNAPFNRRFYLLINVAAGGTNGYFPDGVGGKPWSDKGAHAVNDFWNAKNQWFPTWTSPMVIDSVKVWSDPTQFQSIPHQMSLVG